MNGFLTSCQALRVAFEDRDTVRFILTSFSRADERPEILSFRWLSCHNQRTIWQVVILERPPCALGKRADLVNAAVLEVDSASGTILSRRFFKSLYSHELRSAIQRDLDNLLEGCKAPRI